MAISLKGKKMKLRLKEIVYWLKVPEEKLISGYKWNKRETKRVPRERGVY